MSDYGADKNPSIPAAQDLAWAKKLLNLEGVNVMQWSYGGNHVVRKLAHRLTHSNVLVKFDDPPPDPVIPPDLPPVPAGDACTTCWGNGKPFGVGETPSKMTVVIQDVEKGPDWIPFNGEPPNGTFELIQNPNVPCTFNGFTVGFLLQLSYGGLFTVFQVIGFPLGGISFFGFEGACQTFHVNTVTLPFVGGTATFFMNPIS